MEFNKTGYRSWQERAGEEPEIQIHAVASQKPKVTFSAVPLPFAKGLLYSAKFPPLVEKDEATAYIIVEMEKHQGAIERICSYFYIFYDGKCYDYREYRDPCMRLFYKDCLVFEDEDNCKTLSKKEIGQLPEKVKKIIKKPCKTHTYNYKTECKMMSNGNIQQALTVLN